ncbi:hypothetical protein LAG90_05435 [Marinilongibacter aquaticus]|uniref:hypothetical protein n=1 Tax=Marinilongibacter aquaticus TaxID=2975157 RepID=UPI0021BD3C9F|nr:hypothetical protein [Marinilongibacter aquaticus]UBM60082.1 hypothetical protein LAG90_05435 [Marinilongibacter aquaticus]
MPKNISKELEIEILNLPQKEKDRHLLRLIAQNKLLREQMQFQLLEDEQDLAQRKNELRDWISEMTAKAYPGTAFFLKSIRKMSAEAVWYRRVTKDKYGEVDLHLTYIEQTLEKQIRHVNIFSRKGDVLRTYLVKKVLSILKMIGALHPDFHIDFSERVDKVLQLLHTFDTKIEAQKLNLPKSFSE